MGAFFSRDILPRCLTPFVHTLPENVFTAFHPQNISPITARKVVALASQLVTSNSIWLQFGKFIETGRLARDSGKSFLDNISACSKPILALAGSKDFMAPKATVTALCTLPDRPPKVDCRILGKERGCVEDYGHLDLMTGLRCETEVFPMIIDWIVRNEAPEPDSNRQPAR